jgi:hypothetical protein
VILAFCFLLPSLSELHGALILVLPGNPRDFNCLLHRLDLAPVVGRRFGTAITRMSERQKEQIRLPVFGVAATTAFGHTDKAERFGLTDARSPAW